MTQFERILALLREHGPMTQRDIAADLGVPLPNIYKAVNWLRITERVHIAGYRRDEDSGKLAPRALWAEGHGRMARVIKPPPLTYAEYNRRHRDKKAVRVNSVWQLATQVGDRRLGVTV